MNVSIGSSDRTAASTLGADRRRHLDQPPPARPGVVVIDQHDLIAVPHRGEGMEQVGRESWVEADQHVPPVVPPLRWSLSRAYQRAADTMPVTGRAVTPSRRGLSPR